MKALALAAVAAAVVAFGVAPVPAADAVPSADAAMPRLYSSCKKFNAKYPHGVGRVGTRDKVRAGSEPVRNFRRSNRIFRLAMSWNKGLDRDKDRIACEKH